MKRLFKKSILAPIFCAILALVILFSGCGRITFLQSLKSGLEIQKQDFETVFSFEAPMSYGVVNSTFSMDIKLSGTANGPGSSKMSVEYKNSTSEEYQPVTDIILKDGKVYLNLKDLYVNMLSGMYSNTDAADQIAKQFGDKKYISSDIKQTVQDSMDVSFEYNAQTNLAFLSLINKVLDVVEESADHVDPVVLGQDGNKYTFTLSDENIEQFVQKLGTALERNKDELYNVFYTALEKSSETDAASALKENKEKIDENFDNTVKSLKDFTYNNDTKFHFVASSELQNAGGKQWNLDVSGDVTVNNQTISISASHTVKENTADKEISIDESLVMTEEEMKALEDANGNVFSGIMGGMLSGASMQGSVDDNADI